MDKYDRIRQGYKFDYPDGLVETLNISLLDVPEQLRSKYSRVLEIRNGYVICPKMTITAKGEVILSKTEFVEFTQDFFFEVNEVINFIPADKI